ncbi:MAG: biopolymer transporter ExbD [Pseudomonadota bacterium]
MKLSRPRPRAMPETILPLIDVVFFLLVFSLLVGRMDATAPFELTPPVSDAGTDLPGGGVMVMVSSDGALALDGTAISPVALSLALEEALDASPDLSVRINADGEGALRHLLTLIGRLEEVGAREILLVVTPDPR